MRQVEASLKGALEISEYFTDENPDTGVGQSMATRDELELLDRLRQGDEAAFTSLIDRYHGSLIRLALAHVADRSVAEEVVQESWIGVLEGLDRFEGRSSLKTWIFRIVTNKAKTRGVRESRHTTFSDFEGTEEDVDDPAVDPARFRTSGHWVDYWSAYPQPWDEDTPEHCLLLILRDVEGLGLKEVCGMLAVSEVNQRVLLHRARSKVRQALEQYVREG